MLKDVLIPIADMVLDLSCMVTFFQARHFMFGCVALAIMLLSLGQQVASHSFRELYSEAAASINAGILSDGFLQMTRTEKSVEAPLALMLQMYAFVYVSSSSTFAIVSFALSIIMSVYTLAAAAYSLLYLNMLEEVGQSAYTPLQRHT